MGAQQSKAKAKSKRQGSNGGRASKERSAGTTHTATKNSPSLGAFYAAGPALSLAAPVQATLTIGRAEDPFEREADVVADRVTTGQFAPPISPIPSAGLAGVSQRQTEERREPEETTTVQAFVQRQETEEELEETPVQTLVQRQETVEEEPEDTTVQTQVQRQETVEEEPEETSIQTLVQRQEMADEEPEETSIQTLVQRQETTEEEPEEPAIQTLVQRQEAMEEEPEELPAVQTLVQRQETEEEQETSIQTDPASSTSAAGASSMASAASHAISHKGTGEPLGASTRDTLASRMGADFSDVRVHRDSAAHEATQALNARAFTHQNDIWLGQGESSNDLGLIAHEAAHVVQQTGGVNRKLVQRAIDPEGPKVLKSSAGLIDPLSLEMELPKLRIPKIKKDFTPLTELTLKNEARPTDQVTVWKNKVRGAVSTNLPKKLSGVPGVVYDTGAGQAVEGADDPNRTVFLHIKGATKKGNYLVGKPDDLVEHFLIPRWGPDGTPRSLDVDHKREWQLGGSNDPSNLWLLDASANRSSGARISSQVRSTVRKAVKAHTGKGKHWPQAPDINSIIKKYKITYKKVSADRGLSAKSRPDVNWSLDKVESIRPFDSVKPLTLKQAGKAGLLGDPTTLVVFPLESGGSPKKITGWPSDKGEKGFTNEKWIKGLRPEKVIYTPGSDGQIIGKVFPSRRRKKSPIQTKDVNWALKEVGGVPYTTAIESGSLLPSMRFVEFSHLSPLNFDRVWIDPEAGLSAHGTLKPSLPIFEPGALDIDVDIRGQDITFSKTFAAGDFAVPGPIRVTEAGVTIGYGTDGLEVSGLVSLEMEGIARGTLTAGVDSEGGLEIEGTIDFDSRLFEPAEVSLAYRDGTISGSGRLGIPRGKVKGIKSARIDVAVEDEEWDATGTVEPDFPGVRRGTLTATYDPEKGFEIGGSLELGDDIPGIRGGTLEAKVKPREEGEGYALEASGDIPLDIPGVDANIRGEYDDGAFTAEGSVSYEKGLLKGSITAGVTNRPVSEEGRPAGEPTDRLTAFGGGTVTVRIAPWLQGTIGLRLLPNGEIEVSGSIELPESLTLFDIPPFEKNIFTTPSIDIPILGVSVLGQRIGIFATISGGMDASAGIGPGELRELGLSVTYNPDREEDTRVQGSAQLYIPAHAGLRLFVRGGVGVGIPIVSAEAGLEVGGQLGIEGAATAAVEVDWTPSQGLELDAAAEIFAEPKFRFDISAYVEVEADLPWPLGDITLYENKWELAAFEYGSGLRFGLKFPFHYKEGEPFDVSLSDIEFQAPEIDTRELISGLVDRIT